MTQDQIEEALRRSLSNFTSPTIGRAGSIHDGQQGYILYGDHVAYIVRDLLAALSAPPVARDGFSIIENSILNQMSDDLESARDEIKHLREQIGAPPVAHGAISDAMVEAFISAFNGAAYRHAQTRLNPISSDRVQVREALAVLAAALAPAPAQDAPERVGNDAIMIAYNALYPLILKEVSWAAENCVSDEGLAQAIAQSIGFAAQTGVHHD